MKSTSIYRTEASETLTVSTVLVIDGRSRSYQTAIIVKGSGVTDPIITTKKGDAGFEHDAAVAWARGYRDPHCKRSDRWAAAVADVKAYPISAQIVDMKRAMEVV